MEDRELRLTPQREAVLEVVRESHDHPTAAQIYDRVRERYPGIAYATVYNALGYLVRNGLVMELKFGDGASRYDGRLVPHLHVICTRCGNLSETDMALPASVLRAAEEATGFALDQHVLQLYGLCPQCRG